MQRDAFGRQDRGHGSRGIRPRPGDACPRKERVAGLGEHLVATDVVRIRPGVDDVANGLRRDPLDRCHDGRSAGARARIHDDDTVLADLHRDIPASAGDHEDIGRPHLQHFQRVQMTRCSRFGPRHRSGARGRCHAGRHRARHRRRRRARGGRVDVLVRASRLWARSVAQAVDTSGLWRLNSGLWSLVFGLWSSTFQLRTPSIELRATGYKRLTTGYLPGHQLPVYSRLTPSVIPWCSHTTWRSPWHEFSW